ncbi:cysteine hydrolase family protein [Frateuria aurantia]
MRTALVLIEFQNDFVSEGGALHAGVAAVMKQTNMLANTIELVKRARAMGVAIMHAPITFAPGYIELTERPYGILKGVVDNQAFLEDTWGGAICDQLTPQEGDIIIAGKRGLDCFWSTNLDFILRSKGIEHVAVGGLLTNCCVESTVRSAYEKGYQVISLSDCTAATSEIEQSYPFEKDLLMFSRALSSHQLLAELDSAAG